MRTGIYVVSLALRHYLHDTPQRNRKREMGGGSFCDTGRVRLYTVRRDSCGIPAAVGLNPVSATDAAVRFHGKRTFSAC